MRASPSSFLCLFALLVLSACGREEEPVANRFERQKAEIENKARAIEAQVESDVSAVEAQLANEGAALLDKVDRNAQEGSENGNAQQP